MAKERTLREVAQIWVDRGAKVFPLSENKQPIWYYTPKGFLEASRDPKKLDFWFESGDENIVYVGFAPGDMSLVVLDVDVKGDKRGDEALAELEAKHSLIPRGVQATTPSGGKHIYLRKRDGFVDIGNSNGTLCDDVDVRSDRGYVVATGSPGYTLHQRWPGRTEVPLCPEWLWDLLPGVREDEPAEYDPAQARLEEEWHPKVAEAFDIFDPHHDRHQSMTSAVMQLVNLEQLGYAGSTAAINSLEKRFCEIVGADRAGGLAEASREYQRSLAGARERVETHVNHVLEEQQADKDFIASLAEAIAEKVVEAEKPAAELELPPLKIWTLRELYDQEENVEWLVPGLLLHGTYGQIAGEMKTMKTWNALFMALAVASGMKFMNRYDVANTGPVLFFVGEGKRGWKWRLKRLCDAFGLTEDERKDLPIYPVLQQAPVNSPQFLRTVEWAIEHYDPALTFVDPLMAYFDPDVNAANFLEMGAMLMAATNPFLEHGSTLMILNHFNKQREGRGFSRVAMSGSGEWVDSWCWMKQRDEPDLEAGVFYTAAEWGNRDYGGTKLSIELNLGPTSTVFGEQGAPPLQWRIIEGDTDD